MLVQLHRIARAYGVFPDQVLSADPDRLALCMACIGAADTMASSVEMVFPVVQVGG